MTSSSQEILAQAAQKLATAVTETGSAPNDFAKNLLELLEVSTKINQFEEMASAANAETSSEEAQKWREISLMTMQHASAHLVDQQRRLIEALHGLSESGASLYKAPGAVKPPPGLSPEVKLDQLAVKPPPGLSTPAGLGPNSTKVTNRKPQPPPGLKPPPGLASAGTAPASTPPGFTAKPLGQQPKKKAMVSPPWRMNKQAAPFTPSTDERFGNETKQAASSGMINLDAYESD